MELLLHTIVKIYEEFLRSARNNLNICGFSVEIDCLIHTLAALTRINGTLGIHLFFNDNLFQ
jgi:hypothetical protein